MIGNEFYLVFSVLILRSWYFNGKRYFGCTDGMQITPNESFYFKNDICKLFEDQNPLFWENERKDIKTNSTSNRTHIPHLEIFTDISDDKSLSALFFAD